MLCGIRQGCPFLLSAFVLPVEILTIKIGNSSIAGVQTPELRSRAGAKIKIEQMADDITLFLENKQDMNITFTTLRELEGFTRLKLNVKKQTKQKHYKYVLKEITEIFPLRMWIK